MNEDFRAKLREIGVIALISGGHFWAHCFMLVIPSALPLIRHDFGVSNVSLGMVMAASALMGAGWQFPMGIFSDRYSPRVFLICGLSIESTAMFCQSFAPAVAVMVGIALIGGIADSVFHPADYTILTAKVRPSWLGRAYAVHTFSGFLGFAMAPTLMTFLLAHGTWRHALAIVGISGFATAMLLLACSKMLGGETYTHTSSAHPAQKTSGKSLLRFLFSPTLLVMFIFYVSATLSSNGLQVFGNSAIISLYHVDLAHANTALAAFLWGTVIGVLIGGFIADKTRRLDIVATSCYLVEAVLLCAIGFSVMSLGATIVALFIAGTVFGAVMPSRDLLVRTVTPPGSIGKAFGYVSSGFGVAGIIGPLVYGRLMDLNAPQMIFFAAAGMAVASIGIALFGVHVARSSGRMPVDGLQASAEAMARSG